MSVCCLGSVDEGTQTVADAIFSRAYSPDEVIHIPHTVSNLLLNIFA